MTDKLYVRNWEKWQSYRRDRGAPPWIKVHRVLLTNQDWGGLSDAEKGHILSIWLVASTKDGEIPADPKMLKKLCLLDVAPDIKKLIKAGFLASEQCRSGVKVTSTCHKNDTPEEKENRREGEGEEKEDVFCKTVIDYLNQKTGKLYKHSTGATRGKIKARTKEGFMLQDFFDVIDGRCIAWIGDEKMEQYLRPETIFGTKFESYLQESRKNSASLQQPEWMNGVI